MEQMLTVWNALSTIRAPFLTDEYDLHGLVGGALSQAGLCYSHEKALGPGCRIDFYVSGIGVEVKRGRPAPGRLAAQLARYARWEEIQGLILVVERTAFMPLTLGGKPVRVLSLNRLWGIAL